MDEQIRNVVGLVVLGALGGLGTFLSQRKLRKAGIGASQGTIVRNLRDVADSWREKYEVAEEGRLAAQREMAQVKLEQAEERRDAARDRRDLDDARSSIRELERQLASRPERRSHPRPPTRPGRPA